MSDTNESQAMGISQGAGVPAQGASEQPKPSITDPKLEMATKYERQMRAMKAKFEAEKKAWEAEKAQYLPKSRFKEDPLGALSEAGLDYQSLTETVLNQPNANDPTIRALHNKIKAMEERDAAREKQAQESQTQQYEQTKKQMFNDVKLATNGSPDFELIEKWGAHDLVVEKIEQSFEETGTILDIAQACKDVEEYLITEALKVYETNKIKERLKPKPEVAQAPAAATAARKQADTINVTPKQLNTLTNRLSQEQPQRTSEKERIARALAAFKGELK